MIVTAMLRPAQADDWLPICALLSAENLPTSDLSEASIDNFTVAVDAGQVAGVVAVERYGKHGLLRSLVIDRNWRGSGLGQSLVQAAEAAARDTGLVSLTLLTRTAAPFFAALGYQEIARDSAPAMVRNSPEFTHLCPGNSTCMARNLTTSQSP